MSKWNNWPDYIPFDYYPPKDLEVKQQWYAQHKPLLEQYASEALAALRGLGFNVVIDVSPQTHYHATDTGWSYGGTAERDGFRTHWSIGPMSPRDWTPSEWAAYIADQWKFELLTVVPYNPSSPQITNPAVAGSTASAIDSAWRATQPQPITPTAAPTVQTQSTIQPAQAPPAPQAGTVSAGGSSAAQDPPATTASETLRSFDEWNWHYRQRTGQVPPAPETVGFPVSRRGEQISYQEWQQYTSAWFASQGLPPASAVLDDPGAAGTQPGAAQTNLYSIVAALLALIGMSR